MLLDDGIVADSAPTPMRYVRVSRPHPFSWDELPDFLTRRDVARRWLGERSWLDRDDSRARLPFAMQSLDDAPTPGAIVEDEWGAGWWSMRIDADDDSGASLRITVEPIAPGSRGTADRERVRIKERGMGCRVRVEAGGRWPDPQTEAEVVATLTRMLDQLDTVLAPLARMRRRTRQAVVVVHGIGEQLPGRTLRDFCATAYQDDALGTFVKPDYSSDLFEMRTVNVKAKRPIATEDGHVPARPSTDVYELYWAHLVRDTSLGQVYSWAARLLFAKRDVIPPTLRRHVIVARVLLVLAALAGFGVGVFLALGGQERLSGWLAGLGWVVSVLLVVGGVLAPAVGWAVARLQNLYVAQFAGDAARYLEPKPDNIRVRQEIRSAGVRLLGDLHDRGRYDRIIVVGHSLGSVIAYDIVCRTWIERQRRRDEFVTRTDSRALLDVEEVFNTRPPLAPATDVDEIQSLQHGAWNEYRRNGFDWLISDFVTAGSPLAHGPWLLKVDNTTDFEQLKAERSLPTCPPQWEELNRGYRPTPDSRPAKRRSFTFTHSYPDRDRPDAFRSVQVPNFGAPFALTRWTNLYFPFRGLLRGDPVGGPMQPSFGRWIKDVGLRHPGGGFLGFAHTRYFTPSRDGSAPGELADHADALTDALHLRFEVSIEDLADRLAADTARQAATVSGSAHTATP